MKKVLIFAVASLLVTGSAFAQDETKKEAKMEQKQMKKDAKMMKKEGKKEGDEMKADSGKAMKKMHKSMKKDV